MSKFHVGDEVRFMGGSGVPSHLNGSVATVIRVGNDSTYLLQFENDDRWWASTSQLRPAEIVALEGESDDV